MNNNGYQKMMFHSMRTVLLGLFTISSFLTAMGQSSLCFFKDPATQLIDFKPDDMSMFLNLDKHKIIFFGEQHNRRFDPEIKYHLITDVHRRTGINHVFMEISVSMAWHLNRYLATGDSFYLYRPSDRHAPDGYTLFWKRLYDYNRNLSENAKIVIHGIDFERTDVFLTLKQLSPENKAVPLSLKAVTDTINAHLGEPPLRMWNIIDNKFILYDNSAFISTLRYVQDQLLYNIRDTRAYYGDNFNVVNDIINNRGKVEVRANHRNKTMFQAMERIVDKEHINAFIGFFGAQHTSYAVANSLTNASKGLKNVGKDDILNICEMAYDLKSKDTAFRRKNFYELVALNNQCVATLLPAKAVPGFRKNADFVFIANVGVE